MSKTTNLRLLTASENTQFSLLMVNGVDADDSELTELLNNASGKDLGEIASPAAVGSKLELAKALSLQVADVFEKYPELREDPLLWNALALHWKPFIWGKAAQQRSEYFVFRTTGRDRYRHRLAGPYFLYQRFLASNDVARLLDALAPDAHGELLEQLLSRQYVFVSDAAWSTAARMYLNEEGKIKRGALGNLGGSVRRFGIVMQQLAVTYDMSVTNENILSRLLPPEFERFADL